MLSNEKLTKKEVKLAYFLFPTMIVLWIIKFIILTDMQTLFEMVYIGLLALILLPIPNRFIKKTSMTPESLNRIILVLWLANFMFIVQGYSHFSMHYLFLYILISYSILLAIFIYLWRCINNK